MIEPQPSPGKFAIVIDHVLEQENLVQLEKKFYRWFPRLTPQEIRERLSHQPVAINNLSYRSALRIQEEMQQIGIDVVISSQQEFERQRSEDTMNVISSSPADTSIGRHTKRLPDRIDKIITSTYLHSFVEPQSPSAEAFRTLRTNLQFLRNSMSLHTLLITSCNEGEGKSTIVTNLATTIAQANQKVIIIDADMRKPMLRKAFGLPESIPGLSSVLKNQKDVNSCLIQSFIPNLSLLLAGPTPKNPSELLSLPQLKSTLDELSTQADLIIIDSPPIASVSDAMVLSGVVDGCYLVLNAGKTSRKVAQYTIETMRSIDAKLLGLILNNFLFHDHYYYRNYYYSYYANRKEL